MVVGLCEQYFREMVIMRRIPAVTKVMLSAGSSKNYRPRASATALQKNSERNEEQSGESPVAILCQSAALCLSPVAASFTAIVVLAMPWLAELRFCQFPGPRGLAPTL